MKLWCLIMFFLTAVPAYSEAPPNPGQAEPPPVKNATISGQLMVGKTPMINGFVFLYDKSLGPPPSYVRYWRIPDKTFLVENDGKFSFEVQAGTYYLQATQKHPDADMGPAKVDEFNYIYGDTEGNHLPLIVTTGEELNLGVLSSFLVSPKLQQFDKGITAIEGTVSNLEGKPVVGVMVFAYLSMNTTGKPVFVSTATDINGKYLLRVHDGGTFYLKVRSVIGGGAPENGEFVSVQDQVMVTLKKEQILTGVKLKAKNFSRGSKGNKP